MKIFKQSGPAAQIVVFLAFLIVCCLVAMGSLIAVASLKGMLPLPAKVGTATRTPTAQITQTVTPLPLDFATLTPLPGQWTATSTLFPGESTITPTSTPVQWTIAPTETLVPPSSTPVPEFIFQDTLTPEVDVHLRQVQLKYMAFQAAYKFFATYHQQLGADPTLIVKEKWKTGMYGALSNLEKAASQLAAVDLPDPNYAVYASYLDQLAAETGFMATAYRKGLDRYDPTSMQIAVVHLKAINDILFKADQEFKAAKSRVGFPLFSPEPSSTPGS